MPPMQAWRMDPHSEAAIAGELIAAKLQKIFELLRLSEVLYQTDNASLLKTLKSSNLVSDWHLGCEQSAGNNGIEGNPN